MTTTIRFDPLIEARLTALAQMTGRTKSYYIRSAVEEKLDELEDLYLAQARLEARERRWPLADLIAGKDADLAH